MTLTRYIESFLAGLVYMFFSELGAIALAVVALTLGDILILKADFASVWKLIKAYGQLAGIILLLAFYVLRLFVSSRKEYD